MCACISRAKAPKCLSVNAADNSSVCRPDTDDVLAGPYSTDVQRVLRGRRLVSGPDDQ